MTLKTAPCEGQAILKAEASSCECNSSLSLIYFRLYAYFALKDVALAAGVEYLCALSQAKEPSLCRPSRSFPELENEDVGSICA